MQPSRQPVAFLVLFFLVRTPAIDRGPVDDNGLGPRVSIGTSRYLIHESLLAMFGDERLRTVLRVYLHGLL